MKRLNDSELVIMTLQGNKDSFNCLVERYWPMAIALGISRVSNVLEAEDIAQESFIQAYQNLASLKDSNRFAGWLSRIIQKKCIDYYRFSKINRAIPLSTADYGDIPAFSSNPGLQASQVKMIQDSISKLPEKYQRVIIMRFLAGLSTQEISHQLEIRYGTISVWFHRAYKILRHELSPLFEEVQSK